jgi:hypothetical protein
MEMSLYADERICECIHEYVCIFVGAHRHNTYVHVLCTL